MNLISKMLPVALLLAASTFSFSRADEAQNVELKIGDRAPVFALPDQNNASHALSDYKDKWVVLAFYPADMTGGCTLQAHKMTAALPEFQKRNTQVFGVSVQGVESKKQFCDKEGIGYSLLADVEKSAARDYGVLNAHGVSNRVTFLIAPGGAIAAVDRAVKPASAGSDTLALLDNARVAAPIDAATLQGEIAARKGKVVVVYFWAMERAKEFPILVKLQNQYAAKGLEVLFVSLDSLAERDAKAIPFLKQNGGASTFMLLPDGEQNAASAPQTDIYNRHGERVSTSKEEKTFEQFENLIKPLL